MSERNDPRALIAHVLYRFDVGGLENGVVNLINRLPADRYRHAVIALTEVTDFSRRVQRDDVLYHSLRKPPGQGIWQSMKMAALFRQLRPAIVHTRNLAALDMTFAAAWSHVPVRIHGEHGWDSSDPDGSRRLNVWARRAFRPFVHQYIALSRHLERYLVDVVGVSSQRVSQIYNGVDTLRFHPAQGGRAAVGGSPFTDREKWVVGTVGRLDSVKDQLLLVRAFALALEMAPPVRDHLRLVIAGDGPMRGRIEQAVGELGLQDLVWLAGTRDDIPELLRGLDAFVLPSQAEGISNTVLEAMASALPVLATRVGGNVELVEDGVTGCLVRAGDPKALAQALLDDYNDRPAARARGRAAQAAVLRRFSLESMVGGYDELYTRLLTQARVAGCSTASLKVR